MNVAEIEMRLSELVSRPFAADEFPLQLADIYNAPKATITKLRQGAHNRADRAGDLLWKNKLYYRSADKGSAAITVDELKTRKPAKSHKPRFIIATDGDELSALDTKADDTLHCSYRELNNHFDFFLPLAGIDRYEAVKENPADIKAAGKLAKFHDEIIKKNPDWSSHAKRHELNLFITRVLFCLFAEDTGIFEQGVFTKAISEMGGNDGVQLQAILKQIFDAMNLPIVERGVESTLARDFPYVNGGLFAEQTAVPRFNKRAVRTLIEAAQLDWRDINPDIFGSMIQAVVEPEMRGDLGMHYTSVPNIMKVLQPLFLMSLEGELKAAGSNSKRLHKLLVRISKIRVFDPACGSGNFLIIAYRELRKLEMLIWERLQQTEKQGWMPFSQISLSNFYGIEYADFAAETAKLSLWIAKHQMNIRFRDLFGSASPALPLQEGGNIHHGNALRLDWLQICPPPMKKINKEKVFDLVTVAPTNATQAVIDEEVETYICGNPPYLGGKSQSKEQKADLAGVFVGEKQFGELDYIAGWFLKAARYLNQQKGLASFVTTNSLNQGAQVHQLWPRLFDLGIEIKFAYKPFKWSNSARTNAAVICTIIGLGSADNSIKKLISSKNIQEASRISPYLIPGTYKLVTQSFSPISDLPPIITGNSPYDGGNLILSVEEKDELLVSRPEAAPLLKKLYGSKNFLNGQERWCLWITNELLALAKSIPEIRSRIAKVREKRAQGGDVERGLVTVPHRFRYTHTAVDSLIVIPRVSSERREYIPFGFLGSDCIVSDSAQVIYDPDPWVLSVILSRLHMCWVRTVAGRLKSDIRYSSALCYNTFPFPRLTNEQKNHLNECTWQVVSDREFHAGKTLASLYDPDTMPDNLRLTHQAINDTIEEIYIGRPFKSDMERLKYLFELYAEMTDTTHHEKKIAYA